VLRVDQLTVRGVGFAVLFGAAVVLSGCVTTVDGRAVAGTSTPAISSSSAAPSTSSASPDPTPPPVEQAADRSSYSDLAIGDWVSVWDDDGQADVVVRDARFENSGNGRLLVTVDYECWDGECRYGTTDWSVTDATGERHRAASSSTFGEGGDRTGVLDATAQKRGHLAFELPAGAATVEFDAASGDPATWVVPAAA
jgi:hypothetical protein